MTTKSVILTKQQENILQEWLVYRNAKVVSERLGLHYNSVTSALKSKKVQGLIKKHNEDISNRSMYNEGVIIERLWREATDYANNTGQMRINALAMLAKHIGMFEDKKSGSSNVTFNIVNYQEKVEKEIKVVGEDIVKEAIEELPDNIEIATY